MTTTIKKLIISLKPRLFIIMTIFFDFRPSVHLFFAIISYPPPIGYKMSTHESDDEKLVPTYSAQKSKLSSIISSIFCTSVSVNF